MIRAKVFSNSFSEEVLENVSVKRKLNKMLKIAFNNVSSLLRGATVLALRKYSLANSVTKFLLASLFNDAWCSMSSPIGRVAKGVLDVTGYVYHLL